MPYTLSESVALLVHKVTQFEYIAPLCLIGAVLLFMRGYARSALFFLGALVATEIVVWVLKYLFAVTRPEDALLTLTSYAFPSGHAAMSFALATLGTWLMEKHARIALRVKIAFATLLFLSAAYIAYTRIVIGVHTWEQIGAGALVGIAVPLLCLTILRIYQSSSPHSAV